jgi:predicted secreted protein
MRRFACVLLLLLWALPVGAHDGERVRNRASFDVEARREIANDWTTAHFAVVGEGKDPAVVAADVNRRMSAALEAARRVEGVKVESGRYASHPVYEDRRIVRWRARQELRVEAADVERLEPLIGALQQSSVLLSGIEFSIRPETRDTIEEELLGEALARFRHRAGLVAKGMQASGWSLISLSVAGSGGSRPMPLRSEAMLESAATPAPSFEAGTSEIVVRVEGTIELD